MDQQSLDFLRTLVETASPSGFEQPAQRIFRQYVTDVCDSVETDILGNIIAVINGAGAPRVMITGHSDQIGLIVSYVTDEGFVYFRRIGGLDATACVSQRVIIQGRGGPVYGVVGRKAIHMQEPEDRNKAPKLEHLWVDIGATSKEEALALIRLGDPGVFVQDFQLLPNNRAVSMAFDNKMAIWIVAETMKAIQKRKPKCAVIGVSTVQEEIGSIGAHTSAFSTEPQIAIVTDVGHATDHPGVEKTKAGDYSLGKGPILSRGANINPQVFELLVEAAESENIPYQTEAIGGRSATDADPIQYSRAGIAVGLIHVPLRYMHTPSEMISLEDMENTVKLLTAFLTRIDSKTNLIPD